MRSWLAIGELDRTEKCGLAIVRYRDQRSPIISMAPTRPRRPARHSHPRRLTPDGTAPARPPEVALGWLRFAAGTVLVALFAAAFAIAFRSELQFLLRHGYGSGAADLVSVMRRLPV